VASGLGSLSLVGVPAGDQEKIDLSGGVAQLVKGLPESCRSVALIDDRAARSESLISRDYAPGDNLVSFGSIAGLVPRLERLRIVTADPYQIGFRDLDAPDLRSFVLHGLRYAEAYGAPSDLSDQLGSVKWPRLEEFEARLAETWTFSVPDETGAYVAVYASMEDADDYYYDEYEDDEGWNEGVPWSEELADVLQNLKQTPLKRLALTSFDSAAQLLEALRDHGLPATLEELDLSESSIGSEHVQLFLDSRELFGGLKRLVLNETLLTSEDLATLRDAGLGPEIEHTPGGGARYRFLVGME
jgi:hypothetical protein